MTQSEICIVIANLQSEAIHAGTPDCFASYLATPRNDDNRNILRHCERSEAIHTGTPDCFTLRVRKDGVAGRLHELPCSRC
jgi:hypothetical protein